MIFPAACQPDRVLFSGRDDDKGDGTVPRQVAHSLPVRQPPLSAADYQKLRVTVITQQYPGLWVPKTYATRRYS